MTCTPGLKYLLERDTITLKDRYLVTENSCAGLPEHVDKSAWPSTLLFNRNKSFIFTSNWTAIPDHVNTKLTNREMFLNVGQQTHGVYDYNKFKEIITLKIVNNDSIPINWEKTFSVSYSKKKKELQLIKAKKQVKLESKAKGSN